MPIYAIVNTCLFKRFGIVLLHAITFSIIFNGSRRAWVGIPLWPIAHRCFSSPRFGIVAMTPMVLCGMAWLPWTLCSRARSWEK
jgi:hypothetical protein